MSTSRKVVAILALGPLALSLAATAATIEYSNEATFLSATGSALLTLPNASNVNRLSISEELQIDKIEDGGFYAGDGIGTYWNLAPNYTVKSGIESFDLIPLKPIYAIGFSLYEPTSSARLNGRNRPALACMHACHVSDRAFFGRLRRQITRRVHHYATERRIQLLWLLDRRPDQEGHHSRDRHKKLVRRPLLGRQ